ncbi:hypothetical protein B6D52_02480 [Candidatus Parcubacteria bacterium 4484_255]|nr:MAG: hypothetical protein B6D52_02480 [Candidatus Parcubacteria bacterium 4484_255]
MRTDKKLQILKSRHALQALRKSKIFFEAYNSDYLEFAAEKIPKFHSAKTSNNHIQLCLEII